jgi:hypothetical protein
MSAEKPFIFIIDSGEYIRVMNLRAFDGTGAYAFIFNGKKLRILCANPQREVYEKVKKILRENDIKFSVEE